MGFPHPGPVTAPTLRVPDPPAHSDRRSRQRQAAGGRGSRGKPSQDPQARARQGQGHPLRGRVRPQEGRPRQRRRGAGVMDAQDKRAVWCGGAHPGREEISGTAERPRLGGLPLEPPHLRPAHRRRCRANGRRRLGPRGEGRRRGEARHREGRGRAPGRAREGRRRRARGVRPRGAAVPRPRRGRSPKVRKEKDCRSDASLRHPEREEHLRGAGDQHQPRREGRQGWPRFSFVALVVVGDGAGRVGLGYGKAKEVPAAIAKGVEEAKRKMFEVPMMGTDDPAPGGLASGAGVVLLKPAAPGTGSSPGGPVRVARRVRGHQGHPVEVDGLLEMDLHCEPADGGPEIAEAAGREVARLRGRDVRDRGRAASELEAVNAARAEPPLATRAAKLGKRSTGTRATA